LTAANGIAQAEYSENRFIAESIVLDVR